MADKSAEDWEKRPVAEMTTQQLMQLEWSCGRGMFLDPERREEADAELTRRGIMERYC